MGVDGFQRRTLFGTPKRQAVGSNPAGITILPTRSKDLPSKGSRGSGSFFAFMAQQNAKKLLTKLRPH